MSRNKSQDETDKQTRIAIVSDDKCKPKRCRQECKKSCPVVRMGKLCIEVSPNSKIASLSEELCIGCGICVKVCSSKLKFLPFTFYESNRFACLEMSIRCHYDHQCPQQLGEAYDTSLF